MKSLSPIFLVWSCAQRNHIVHNSNHRSERKALLRKRWFWMLIICVTRGYCQGTWFFERLIRFANCPLKCVICFSPSITRWKGTFCPPFILIYWWMKGMDRWNSCWQCTVASRHYPIEDGSCSFFSSFDWVTWKTRSNSSLPPTTISLFWHFPSFYYILIWHFHALECPPSH